MNKIDYADYKPKYTELNITNPDSYYHNGDIFDLANAFLSIGSMTHKKLQKLCYYAKAWYLALYDENLINDQFEAWVHGAVQPDLYQKYKPYGFNYIPKLMDTKRIPEEFLNFAKEIYESYGAFDGDELERLNHNEIPWERARIGLKPWQNCEKIISEQDMKDYYRTLINEGKNSETS
jgi:uncharacterized phage-associated protein